MNKLYKHYKGGLYEFITYAIQEKDSEVMAIYKSVADGIIWVRPRDEFDNKFIPIES